MSASIEVIDNFSVTIDGVTYTGKQGNTTDAPTDSYGVTITGDSDVVPFTLATATVRLLYDASVDFPATFSYFFFWGDQDCYIQVIGSATNFSVKWLAKVPFKLTYGSMLGVASTSVITGGGAPSTTTVTKILVGNYSGTSMRGLSAIFN